ncbi:MAG: RNA polymerase sigma factor [Chloroflexota bacterium]|nr:RNA polymerase sigma factor [Chloroflexota bacterium]
MSYAARAEIPQLADASLVDMAAEGDADAFDLLIRPRLDRLFRMAVAITRSEADARDAVQEACVSAWRELPRLRDRNRFDAWLAQILVNACRGLLRGRRRIRVREIPAGELGGGESERDSRLATSDDAAVTGEVDAIRRAFERLDATTRSLLALHYVEERPLAEIGRLVGAPVGTIKWRLSRARQALDRALEVERR